MQKILIDWDMDSQELIYRNNGIFKNNVTFHAWQDQMMMNNKILDYDLQGLKIKLHKNNVW